MIQETESAIQTDSMRITRRRRFALESLKPRRKKQFLQARAVLAEKDPKHRSFPERLLNRDDAMEANLRSCRRCGLCGLCAGNRNPLAKRHSGPQRSQPAQRQPVRNASRIRDGKPTA